MKSPRFLALLLVVAGALHAATPEENLAALGLALPPTSAPVANYVPAVRTGNLLFLAGNIGRDAETRQTTSGDEVTSWPVAVTDRSGKDAPPLWFDCSLWGKRGASLEPYLTKGGKVTVTGDLTTRTHEGKTYLGIRVADVTLQSSKQDDAPAQRERPAPRREEKPRADRFGADLEDEVPF